MFLRLRGLIGREETGNDGPDEKAVIIPTSVRNERPLIEEKAFATQRRLLLNALNHYQNFE